VRREHVTHHSPCSNNMTVAVGFDTRDMHAAGRKIVDAVELL